MKDNINTAVMFWSAIGGVGFGISQGSIGLGFFAFTFLMAIWRTR